MWILRWPLVVLILVFVIVACLIPAGGVAAYQWAGPQFERQFASFAEHASSSDLVQAGLWFGAAFALFVAAIRLIRRTQAFWAWLIGFGLYGARWGMMQRSEGWQPWTDISAAIRDDTLWPLAFLLLVGVVILIVDAGDRAYWAKQAT